LWIFLGAPFVEATRGNRALSGALSMITAAVVGVILNLAVWFAIHTLFRQSITTDVLGRPVDLPVLASLDPRAAGLASVALIAAFRYQIGTLPLLAAAAAAGPLLRLVGALP
jgi:chromate transporter